MTGATEQPGLSPSTAFPGAVPGSGIDAAVPWHYGDPIGEQRALADGRGIVDLSHYDIVTVTGPDRLKWLHSITSQHIETLQPGTSTELLVLDIQGRIEYAPAVIDDGETTWLIVDVNAGAPLAKWLDMMKFTLRVEIALATDAWAAIGSTTEKPLPQTTLAWADPWPHTAPGGTRYGVADDEHPGAGWQWRLELVPRGELVAALQAGVDAGATLAGTWASEALRVAAGRPRHRSEVDDRTIPHELDWLRTAVHLHKGCYRGQETIARVHNLGKPPRRLTMLHLDGSENVLPQPGSEITAPSRPGRPIGVITSAVQHHELGPIALAMIKRATDPSELLTVTDAATGVIINATQETLVNAEGESVDRPPPRGPVNRELPTRQMLT